MRLDLIKDKNQDMTIYTTRQKEFKQFGNVIVNYDFKKGLDYMENQTEVPHERNVYIAADNELEAILDKNEIEQEFYGNMPCQIGFCNGKNSKLNGLEYHKGSEIIVAVTDLILLLGDVRDIEEGVYQSEKLKAFYLEKGEAVEIYGTTLHFAPCKVLEEGFKSIVILPQGTNLPLTKKTNNKEIFAKNKWLFIHEEATNLREKGAYTGIIGENLKINSLEYSNDTI
jgi:hypothetical protein